MHRILYSLHVSNIVLMREFLFLNQEDIHMQGKKKYRQEKRGRCRHEVLCPNQETLL